MGVIKSRNYTKFNRFVNRSCDYFINNHNNYKIYWKYSLFKSKHVGQMPGLIAKNPQPIIYSIALDENELINWEVVKNVQ